MGCTSSIISTDVVGSDLKLPNTKLKFTVEQLKILNERLANIQNDVEIPTLSDDAESVAERLIQGLICGAASKDPRFKSKFIVVLHRDRICQSNSLEYLVLLDELDGLCSFGEGPPGCARIRLQDQTPHDWQEFLTPSGFLRRDKVIERWVEILAAAAADGVIGNESGLDTQHSTAPGHLVSPITLQQLRKMAPQEQCFYGNVKEGGQFPSSRDYRIAIVEGNPWIRVRLAGGVLGTGTEAKLALGIAFHGWPAGSDFPSRVPLGHPDAYTCYKAAQTGFFVVGGGPASGIQWSEKASGWQVWTSGARSLLSARGEGFSRIGKVCGSIVDYLRAAGQPPMRVVSRFMVEEAILWRCEKNVGRGPAGNLRSWSSSHLAHQVLIIYDALIGQIKKRTGRHYFFQEYDMIKMTVWRGARIGERDWRGDFECLVNFLKGLHEESALKVLSEVKVQLTDRDKLESALCCRWGLLLQELTPAGSTKGRRLAGAPTYSPRQISYVAATSRELLNARQLVIQESNEWYRGSLSAVIDQYQDPVEDLIHLIAIMLDQARDHFIKTNFNDSKQTKEYRVSFERADESTKDSSKRQKLKNSFDTSATYFIDSIRRDVDVQKEDLSNDSVLIRVLLKYLYKSVDDDKKYLSTVLKPYLEMLFATSHENCWHMEEIKKRVSERELESLKAFCNLVGEGHISPADGVLEAASKGWQWAESVLDTLDNVSYINSAALRMLFTATNGNVLKFDLSLPNDPGERENWNLYQMNRFETHTAKLKLAERCVVEAFAFSLEEEDESNELSMSTKKTEDVSHKEFPCEPNSKTNTLKSYNGTTVPSEFDSSSKYHTLRSLDSKYNTLRNSENLFGSSWSNVNTIKLKDKLKPPTVLGKLNSVEAEYYDSSEDIDYSMHCNLRDLSPMNLALSLSSELAPHREYIGVIKALINMQKYTILQELAGWLGDNGEKTGTLKAIHRLARASRRASGPAISSSVPVPSMQRHVYTLSPRRFNMRNRQRASIKQYYRKRNIDALSGDERNIDKKSGVSNQGDVITPRTHELLDVEVQREYMEKNRSLQNDVEQMAEINERYMEMCREAIRDSHAKLNKSSFSKIDKEIKSRILRKESSRSSSVGRNAGREIGARLGRTSGEPNVLGHASGKEAVTNSLLGTCRKSRLQQATRKSVLPRASSVGDGLIGDALKVSPLYVGAQSEYDLMTQSILQSTSHPATSDRQRQLTNPRDKSFLLHN